MHIKSLSLPESKKDKTAEDPTDASIRGVTNVQDSDTNQQAGPSKIHPSDHTTAPNIGQEHESEVVADDEVTWDETFELSLSSFLSETSIAQLKQMYLDGPEPPRVSDNGWVNKVHKKSEDVEISEQDAPPHQDSGIRPSDTRREKHQHSRGGRGRQRGRGGRSQGSEREDNRKVLSEVCHLVGQSCHFSHKRCSLSAQKLHGRLFIR